MFFFHWKGCGWLMLAFCLLAVIPVNAQVKSGFWPLNRLGVSYQNAWGLDMGLVSYNSLYGRGQRNFWDVSIGAESYFVKPYVLSPKISLDWGVEIGSNMLTFGGGLEVARPTDFSQSTWMVTPKAGITLGSLIRLYYGYHLTENAARFPEIGNHRISLEVNMAAFHDFKIGL